MLGVVIKVVSAAAIVGVGVPIAWAVAADASGQLDLFYTALGAASLLVGGATAYLRLFVSNQNARLERSILHALEERYMPRELSDQRFEDVKRRLAALERGQGG